MSMHCETDKKRRLPYIEPTIRTIAGFLLSMIGVLLYLHDEKTVLWLGMLFFISLNLFQSGFSRWCLMEKLLKYMGLRSELDEIRQLGERLHESAERQAGHMDTLNMLNEAVLELSLEGEILSFSDGWNRLLGQDISAAETDRKPLVDCVEERDADIITRMLERIMSTQEHVLRIRFRLIGSAKDECWVEGHFMRDQHDTARARIKGVLRDVTEAHQQERQIHHMAMHDALTGLPNRSLLEGRMTQALAHAKRYGFRVGVLFIDLDNFKQVNDANGHKSGDQLLVRVSHVLGQRLRCSDTLARWGGDEFVVLLPDLIDRAAGMRAVATDLMTALEDELQNDGIEAAVTLSIGAANYPGDADNAEVLLARADKALYFAKSQGRNNVQVYGEMRESHLGIDDFDITARFSKAVKARQMQVHYQLIVDAVTHAPAGIEALARWHDERHGWVSPASFIPIAENLGLIQDVSRQVIEQSLVDFKKLRQHYPALFLSVNISTRLLADSHFSKWLCERVDSHEIDPHRIKLEMTESLSLLGACSACKVLRELQETGFYLSLDDFGTGFSSLSQLHELPFNELKIDMSFVRRYHEEKGRIMLAGIIGMGHALGFRIVAEGVEQAAQARVLRDLGGDLLQGYFFSKPLPVDECLLRLQKKPETETCSSPMTA
ncbi:diguanylate cyclase/phosphodiesterase (GGDEF & EAL domains) with PAS/PAC sensor(s) [hydrothermal vent metagenome]|uniref:Diguanylate cyclase/phosphodiesterase (GGDEF & EAL domains) with PAS/PAC sensor(S) n=1 Tax=hydrothermal vent metagenome TaxID=652676 RepID=A0A3B0YU87_9ZZZZ